MSRLARLLLSSTRFLRQAPATPTASVAAPTAQLLYSEISTSFQPLYRLWSQLDTAHLHGARCFAAHHAKDKGRKSNKKRASEAVEEESEGAESEAGFDPEPIEQLMQHAVEFLEKELAGVRTGRAHPGLLENLLVNASGDHIPIKACGTVTVRNPQLLAISLYDPSLAKAVDTAIRTSPLSLNPAVENSEVLVPLPRMTNETIQRMIKLVHAEAEGAHLSIRRARQKGMDAIKKAYKSGSQDEKRREEKEMQKLHDHYIAMVDKLRKAKDAELKEHRD